MKWELMAGVIKIAGFLSTCGGPTLLVNRLKGTLGMPTASLICFVPVAVMIVGAFHLPYEPGDSWARWAVRLGRVGVYMMVAMQLYGIWLILGGFRSPALPLYWIGIVTGLLSAVAYEWAAAKSIARDRASSEIRGPDDRRPIEPS